MALPPRRRIPASQQLARDSEIVRIWNYLRRLRSDVDAIDTSGGSAPAPASEAGPATQMIETSGPTTLDFSNIADGDLFQRDGTDVIGVDINDLLPDGYAPFSPHVFMQQEFEYTFAGRAGTACPMGFNPDDGRIYTAVNGYLLELNCATGEVTQIAGAQFSGDSTNPICISNEGHIYVGGTGAAAANTLFKVDGGTHAVTDKTGVFSQTNQSRFMCNVPSLGHIWMLRNGSQYFNVLGTAGDTAVTTNFDLEAGTRQANGVWWVDHPDNDDGYILLAYGNNGDGKTKLHVVDPASQTSVGFVLISDASGGGAWVWNNTFDRERLVQWLADVTDFWEIDLTDPTTPVATKRTNGALNMGGNSTGNPVAYVPATNKNYFFDNGFWDRLNCFDYDNFFIIKQAVLLTSRAALGGGVWPLMACNPFDGRLCLVQTTDTITITVVVP